MILRKTILLKQLNFVKIKKIFPAYSNVSFNLFLILHKQDYNKQTTPNDNYLKDLRNAYKLDSKIDIKNETECLKIIEQINLEMVKTAIKRAKIITLESKKYNKEITKDVYEQPFLNINEFLEQVFKELNS